MPTDPTPEPVVDESLSDLLDDLTFKDPLKPVRNLDDEVDDDDGSTAADFLDDAGILVEREVPDIKKPWMEFHKFRRVETVEEVNQIVDECIKSGHCSLDLETEGLDNRIFYDVEGKPYTKHKIVGFCIAHGKAETGYYVPIRHTPKDGGADLNVKPVGEVEEAIKRLCEAAKPGMSPGASDLLAFKDVLTPPRVIIDFWHASFDQEFLYPITGIDFWHPDSFECGNLASFVKFTSDKSLSLKDKSNEILRDPKGHPYEMIKLKELFPLRGSKIEFHLLAPDEPGVLRYACSDAICTRLLCSEKPLPQWEEHFAHHKEEGGKTIIQLVREKYGFIYRVEKQVAQVKRVMERNRVKINRGRISALRVSHEAAREAIRAKIQEFAQSKGFHSFEPGSSKQLSDMLFKKDPGLDITLPGRGADDKDFPNGKPPINDKSGQFKTGGEILEEMAKIMGDNAPPILKWIVEFREEDKLLGTYLDSLDKNPDKNDELRFQFKQTGASTGRFSAPAGDNDQGYSGVPIHGIPSTSDLRTCFEAREGYTMVKCDYAGEELRIVTNLSNEKVWIKEFLEGSGDLHTITARAFFGKHDVSKDERSSGKTANFALVYGGGPAAIMRATGCDRMEGLRRKQAFDKSVPEFAKWVKGQHIKVKKELGVWTAFARWVAIPDANSIDNAIRAACERHATNFPIQGCLNKCSVVLTDKGYKSIGDLESKGTKGLRVWTGTQWATFTAHNMGPWQLADIRLSDGTDIQCDTRHKLLVVSDEGYSWVDYKDLRPGDKVATSLCAPMDFNKIKPLFAIKHGAKSTLSVRIKSDQEKELWYWLGRYMGEGWIDHERGLLTFAFGRHEQEAINAALKFWKSVGTNPTSKLCEKNDFPSGNKGYVVKLDVWSIDLTRWLHKLGLVRATAHTKRLPPRLFQETLANRMSFMRGFMDSDGHRPRLPLKIKGQWEKGKKGNPYNIHLCQRELLADTKLLLRTIGVESNLRGPYHSLHKGKETTSYRLDIQRRMFDTVFDSFVPKESKKGDSKGYRNILPKFNDLWVPSFLVNEFLSKGPFNGKDFPDLSLYNLYLRLKKTGRVGIYTFKKLLQVLGVELSQPLYGYKRIVSKTDRQDKDDTYTLSVDDSLHRFDAEGVITKNSGADILKISMILLHKEFNKRGWLRNGGDDSVRMLLTVHDEIVFEIRHNRVTEAIPIIVRLMEQPTKMVNKAHSPPWIVPLVTEPLVGPTWGTGYPCERVPVSGEHEPKEGEVVVGGFIYGSIRTVDLGKEIPGAGEVEHWRDAKKIKIRMPDAPWLREVSGDMAAIIAPQPSVQKEARVLAQSSTVLPANSNAMPVKNGSVQTITVKLRLLSKLSVKQVRGLCATHADPDGALLCLTDPMGIQVLIDPKIGIRVDPDGFAQALLECNLSDGSKIVA